MPRAMPPQRPLTHLESYTAALVLAVGMGFGRFSYTGMYPIMVRDGWLSVSSGSIAASLNYLGYLAGALALSRAPVRNAPRFCALAVLGSILCLAALGWNGGTAYIDAVRGVAGVFSAFAMVGASQWLLQGLGYPAGTPLLYAGIGAGILLSAELMAAGNRASLASSALWLDLAAGAVALGGLVLVLVRAAHGRVAGAAPAVAPAMDGVGRPLAFAVVSGVYALAGLGYIITATYLPLLIRQALPGADMLQIWAAFGLGAVPSCFLWHALDRRIGARWSLMLNMGVQAFGVILPLLSRTPVAYLASALLVGGCFLGTPTIAMPAARRAARSLALNVMATMTFGYSVGQVAGPLIADALHRHGFSLDAALVVASAALAAGMLGCLL